MLSENDITDIIEETFTTTEERFGEMVTIELKPGGADIPVTEENKQEYVDLIVDYRISRRVEEQSDELMKGLSELIPLNLLTVFDEREMELLISGMPVIDVYVFPHDTHEFFPEFLLVATGPSLQTIKGIKLTMKLSNGSGNACEAGHQSRRLGYCNSRLGRRVFPPTVSEICKARMDRDDSPSRSLATRRSCRLVICALTRLICHLTRAMFL
jgi:hypothetical protein